MAGGPRTEFDRAVKESGLESDKTGTRHLDDLARVSREFARVATTAGPLACVSHVLQREFRVLLMSGRDPLPGYGQQGLHADWVSRPRGEPYAVVTTNWPLDDFTEINGGTRLVPGTHLHIGPIPKAFVLPQATHPAEIVATPRAGSVLVFDEHLWHSGRKNVSSRRRRAIQCQFVALDRAPRAKRSDEPPEHLGAAAKIILGY